MVVSIVQSTIRIVQYETIQQLHDTNRLMNFFCSYIVFVLYDSDSKSHESFRIDPNHSIHRHKCSSRWHLSRRWFLLQHLWWWRLLRWCHLRWRLLWWCLSRWPLLSWCLSLSLTLLSWCLSLPHGAMKEMLIDLSDDNL